MILRVRVRSLNTMSSLRYAQFFGEGSERQILVMAWIRMSARVFFV